MAPFVFGHEMILLIYLKGNFIQNSQKDGRAIVAVSDTSAFCQANDLISRYVTSYVVFLHTSWIRSFYQNMTDDLLPHIHRTAAPRSPITDASWEPLCVDGARPTKLRSRWESRDSWPGDITSCVFEGSVVCVIWFRWKHSVWIAVGYGFPMNVPSPLYYPAHTSAYSGELWSIMVPVDAVFHA